MWFICALTPSSGIDCSLRVCPQRISPNMRISYCLKQGGLAGMGQSCSFAFDT